MDDRQKLFCADGSVGVAHSCTWRGKERYTCSLPIELTPIHRHVQLACWTEHTIPSCHHRITEAIVVRSTDCAITVGDLKNFLRGRRINCTCSVVLHSSSTTASIGCFYSIGHPTTAPIGSTIHTSSNTATRFSPTTATTSKTREFFAPMAPPQNSQPRSTGFERSNRRTRIQRNSLQSTGSSCIMQGVFNTVHSSLQVQTRLSSCPPPKRRRPSQPTLFQEER